MLPAPQPTQQALVQALAAHGLRLRGHWTPTPADPLPCLPGGQAAGAVWMVGVVGSAFWPHFKASPFFSDGLSDPLDRWSRAIGEELASRFGGIALYPFDGPPYHPFQRWADRAEATQTSAMLLRIHPEYGLWHAYRFALALPGPAGPAAKLPTTSGAAVPHRPNGQGALGDLCTRCSGQPCLQACPVQAYTGTTFVLQACASHLHSGQGADCLQSGCLARRACPVGTGQRYTPEHAAFHMRAFADRH
jgi:hypothetical protein